MSKIIVLKLKALLNNPQKRKEKKVNFNFSEEKLLPQSALVAISPTV
jgi:hypothetical protein